MRHDSSILIWDGVWIGNGMHRGEVSRWNRVRRIASLARLTQRLVVPEP